MSLSRTFEKGVRTLRKIERHAPILTFIVASFVTIFLTAGGVYDIIENPVPLIPLEGGGWTFIYPGAITYQTLSESVVAAIIYILAVGGFYTLYWSTRHVYRPRQAYLLFLVGFVIIIIAVAYTHILLRTKLG